jgi:NAD(P)H-nitrite reductase large subunit
LKAAGLSVTSIGEIQEDGDRITSRVTGDAAAQTYRRVVFRDGIPIGGILFGTSSGLGELRKLVESGLDLEKLKRKVVPEASVVA